MKIAAQHSKRQRVAAGKTVEERLLLGGIALQRRDVARRREQRPFFIESDLADAAPSGLHEAAVAAGKAADRAGIQLFYQIRFPNTRIERLREAQRKLPGVS
jgi:hypothetical protein